MRITRTNTRAFSLVELIVVIAVIGTVTAVAVPVISNIRDSGIEAKNLQNAKNIERMSAALASLGVAHVIPDSMGGVEATARLLREGVIVPEGPMSGETFKLASLTDEDITGVAEFLRVQYDMRELRLVFEKPPTTFHMVPSAHMFCQFAPQSPARIERVDIA